MCTGGHTPRSRQLPPGGSWLRPCDRQLLLAAAPAAPAHGGAWQRWASRLTWGPGADDGSVRITSTGLPAGTAAAPKAPFLVSDRLEIISPHDVSLVKFLGSGGYGEVYLGKWHSSEAAIKCLNASLFFPGGDGSQVPHCLPLTER